MDNSNAAARNVVVVVQNAVVGVGQNVAVQNTVVAEAQNVAAQNAVVQNPKVDHDVDSKPFMLQYRIAL